MRAIRAGRAFDGERTIAGGATVLVEGERIVGVEPASFAPPDGCDVLDFPDGTVLPGLIDAHVHLCGDSTPGALERLPDLSGDQLDAVITRSLQQQLAAGVTTVRDLGDRHFAVLERRDRQRSDPSLVEPTIVAAGPPVTTPRGHCWFMGGEVDGADAVRVAVAERRDRGVDLVKVMASGGAMTPGTDVMACQFDRAGLRHVVEEAHAAGLPITAHAHGLPSIEQAVAAGVDGIEHCTCLVPTGIEASDALLARLADKQIAVCPTMGRASDAEPPPVIQEFLTRHGITWEFRQRLVGRMHEAGVQVVAGADTGISPGKPHGLVARSVADFVAGGFSAEAALASATSVAAEVCGLPERKGRLRVGFDADLLVVDGDPFAEIAVLEHVAAVMSNGRLVVGER